MKIQIWDQDGNQHNVSLYVEDGEIMISGYHSLGSIKNDMKPTKYLKSVPEEEDDNEMVFEIKEVA